MQSFDDAKETVYYAREVVLERVKVAHEWSVIARKATVELRIETLLLMTLLRSALDYTMRGLYEVYSPSAMPSKVYFPIRRFDQTPADFRARVERTHGTLPSSVLDIIISYQDTGYGQGVLSRLDEIVSPAKHEQLSVANLERMKTIKIEVGIPANSVDFKVPIPAPQSEVLAMLDGFPLLWMMDFALTGVGHLVNVLTIP